MYIWLGYSRTEKRAGWFLGFPDISKSGIFTKTLHFSPKYLSIYFGKDGINSDFIGKTRYLHACYGKTGCFYWVDKPDVEVDIPEWIPRKLNNQFEWFVEEDTAAETFANDEKPAFDVEISEEKIPGADVEAIYEYGVGIWTRWLMNYPDILL